MKLLRVGAPGRERPAALDNSGRLHDLSAHVADIDGGALSDAAPAKLRGLNLESLPLVRDGTRIGPCVGKVGKFICIGLNYADHA